MVSKPRKAKPAKLTLVQVRASPLEAEMLAALNDVFDRIESGETLALAIVEVRRMDIISQVTVGQYDGWRHKLVAGASYLLTDLLAPEDD